MRGDRHRLQDILEAIERVERYTDRGRKAFDADELIQNWVIHHLEIIGEACGAVSPQVREANPQVAWRGYVGLRNILVHQYFGIDYEPVWLAATVELAELKSHVQMILDSLPDDA